MPLYVYVCERCGKEFEVYASRGEDAPREEPCPNCPGIAVRQIRGGIFRMKEK